MTFTVAERVLGCLTSLANGDAVGKQAEMLSRDEVLRWYPQGIRGFEGRAGTTIPRYAGNSKREWRIGETTDDTERTIAVARAIIAEGDVSHAAIGRELLQCVKCVHPGVASLWEFHKAADPLRVATSHDGCGAAIRVSPVGIFHSSSSLEKLVIGAREASISTHGGSLAIAAAAANAAAVSGAIDGASGDEVLQLAAAAAADADRRWPSGSGAAMSDAIRAVNRDLATLGVLRPVDVAARWFPDNPMTIVPLALGLATVMRSAEEAILLAASVGGDSDSVASIAGGILGAMYPNTVNPLWRDVVEDVNRHDLAGLASALTPLRR